MDYMWKNVGNASFSAGEADYTSLVINPVGLAYVAYVDWGNAVKATVMKYDSVFVGINETQESRLL